MKRKISLSIRRIKEFARPWLLKRTGGSYEQHAHFFTERDAKNVRRLIDANKYPHSKEYRIAMKRILTDSEFKALNRKEKYINSQKGLIK